MSISEPPNYGSPDWQRGFYSAQKLLATIPAGQQLTDVTIPPNCESLVVMVPSPQAGQNVQVKGTTTGLIYVGTTYGMFAGGGNAETFVFDCSSEVDSQVQIEISPTGTATAYVYADAGVHVMSDMNKRVSESGFQYVIPCAPGLSAGDLPPVELELAYSQATTADVQVLAAPGAGKRYRIFTAQVIVASGTLWAGLEDLGSNLYFCWGANGSPGNLTYGPSGLPLSNNAGINLNISAAGTIYGTVVYTTENV